MLLIKNGRVIDPARKKERNADIVVKDGKIEKIYAEGTLPAEAEAAAKAKQDAEEAAAGIRPGNPHGAGHLRCVHFGSPDSKERQVSE